MKKYCIVCGVDKKDNKNTFDENNHYICSMKCSNEYHKEYNINSSTFAKLRGLTTKKRTRRVSE